MPVESDEDDRGRAARLRLLIGTDMELTTVWFILIAVLWTGYFFLEGFDFGVGMLLHPLGHDDTDRRVMINTIGPVWDGNEVWLLTAGGATFAAFPNWYATLFSGFYLPLFLILVALIIRGVALSTGKGGRRRAGDPGGTSPSPSAPGSPPSCGEWRSPTSSPASPSTRIGQLHRQPVHPAQPLRAARRPRDCDAVRPARRQLPGPQDRR